MLKEIKTLAGQTVKLNLKHVVAIEYDTDEVGITRCRIIMATPDYEEGSHLAHSLFYVVSKKTADDVDVEMWRSEDRWLDAIAGRR